MASTPISVLCTLSNSTVSPLTKPATAHHDWFGHVIPPYPQTIENDSSEAFSHDGDFAKGSESAVVYRVDGKFDWMVCWKVGSGKNIVYTEIKTAGYFDKADWGHYKNLLERKGSETSGHTFGEYKTNVTIDEATSPANLEGVILSNKAADHSTPPESQEGSG